VLVNFTSATASGGLFGDPVSNAQSMTGARHAKVPQSLITDLPENVHVDVIGLEGSAPLAVILRHPDVDDPFAISPERLALNDSCNVLYTLARHTSLWVRQSSPKTLRVTIFWTRQEDILSTITYNSLPQLMRVYYQRTKEHP
jgi:hypothetical protein